MGKFDKKRQNEPGMKAPAGKRHKVRCYDARCGLCECCSKVKSVVGTGSELSGEKEKNMEALDKMLRGDASSKFNVDKGRCVYSYCTETNRCVGSCELSTSRRRADGQNQEEESRRRWQEEEVVRRQTFKPKGQKARSIKKEEQELN